MSDASDAESGQVSQDAAEVYQDLFVPSLFEPWAERVADAAKISPGDAVLDVACGTGVLAREARRRVGEEGQVTGLDLNPAMLAVARREASGITWEEGPAESLPFDDGAFDAVVCQFSLMFFEDREAALAEMWRVLGPGGRLAVAVWDRLENSPGYLELASFLEDHLGAEGGEGLRASFTLGDPKALTGLFAGAGIQDAEVATLPGEADFPSLASFVGAELKGWTLADSIDDARFEELLAEAKAPFARFIKDDGRVVFPLPAHLVTATKG